MVPEPLHRTKESYKVLLKSKLPLYLDKEKQSKKKNDNCSNSSLGTKSSTGGGQERWK